MDNESIEKLTEIIQTLCLENEVLRIMVKHNWSPNQIVSWKASLSENLKDSRLHSQVSANFQSISAPAATHVLGSKTSTFQSLLEAIRKTRTETAERVDKA